MDKNHFISILHRYSGSSVEEAEKLLSLKDEYPYSQLLHTLAARVSRDHDFEDSQETLQMAAVHAADRSVLKEIITAPYQPASNGESKVPEKTVSEETAAEIRAYSIKSVDSVDVADEVIRDLEKLNTLRHNFEMMFVEYSEVSVTPASDSAPVAEEPKPVAEAEPVKESAEPKTVAPPPAKRVPPKRNPAKAKNKKERIIELAKAMEAAQTTDETTGKRKGAHQQPDALIEEIQSSKEEIVPESDKQKEQIALINHFIKTQPSITSARERQHAPASDLIPIKSGEFGDNIVSETLVEILIKQGKKDKAIEVLKKLIWKYPQKKAYFASQIEDLKK